MHFARAFLLWAVFGSATALAHGAESAQTPESSEADQDRILAAGQKVFDSGRRLEAIRDYYDEDIEHYRTTYAGQDKLVYCAKNPGETVIYAALGSAQQKDTIVLGSTWADAYLLKAYAIVELGEVVQAHEALDSALALSPQSAHYLSELGYLYQAERNWEKSLQTYAASADAAELTSAEETKKSDLGRAWRGQGFSLTELGRFDEAEALYKKCLKIDRHDDQARNEIKYIRELRTKSGGAR